MTERELLIFGQCRVGIIPDLQARDLIICRVIAISRKARLRRQPNP